MGEVSLLRRAVLRGFGGAVFFAGAGAGASAPASANTIDRALAKLEKDSGGRLGVHALDTATGRTLGCNQDKRFGMCSTFKLLLAAAVLREADAGRIDLAKKIHYTKADMVFHAPVTEANLGKVGMSVRDLAEAAQVTSDNVAANLLIKRLGGPAGFTAKLREMSDTITRIDRYEPEMNRVPVGEIRDTTTPRAMAETVARVLIGDVLKPNSRATLIEWMVATKTGLKRIRAGLPKEWHVGDKTGTGHHPTSANKHNDVAIIWPPGRAPIIVTVYFEAAKYFDELRAEDDAVLSKVGELVATW